MKSNKNRAQSPYFISRRWNYGFRYWTKRIQAFLKKVGTGNEVIGFFPFSIRSSFSSFFQWFSCAGTEKPLNKKRRKNERNQNNTSGFQSGGLHQVGADGGFAVIKDVVEFLFDAAVTGGDLFDHRFEFTEII